MSAPRLRTLAARTAAALALGLALVSSASACASSTPASPVGIWGVDQQGSPSLTFSQDGSVSGSDGCNRISGSWSQSGSTITTGPMVSTMMYCEGVDTWLSQIDSATMDGDTLTVIDQDGQQIGTLERSSDAQSGQASR